MPEPTPEPRGEVVGYSVRYADGSWSPGWWSAFRPNNRRHAEAHANKSGGTVYELIARPAPEVDDG